MRNRGTSGRSKGKPLGRSFLPSVHAANVMVARVVILLMLCEAKKVWWCVEQPTNSLLEHHPAFQKLLHLRSVRVRRLSTAMGWFGAPTRKPSWIYSSASNEHHFETALIYQCAVISITLGHV